MSHAGLVVIVCGGRDFTAPTFVRRALDGFHSRSPIAMLIHGGARGADSLAATWAADKKIQVAAFPADWDGDGKRAGPVRNARMLAFLLEQSERAVVAFPGGTGTAHMMKIAKSYGVPVWEMAFSWQRSRTAE